MSEYKETGQIEVSAMKADVHPQTASKYIHAGQAPAELQAPHTWRTRPDPLERVWAEALTMLEDAPELEAKSLFEHFLARPDSGLEEGHLRTFQRRVRHWHATKGPEREVFFAQQRKPGELMQLDWTYAKELNVTIQGQALDHLFCQCVLPYSNWQWATRCLSESFLSLVSGLQAALGRLGKSPPNLGTDNTSAATHDLEDVPGRPRAYNSDYLELCTHYDLSPITINVGCPNEHGDVESLNRHLKRRLNQHLILRGSREFASLEAYDRFVEGVLTAANAKRQRGLGGGTGVHASPARQPAGRVIGNTPRWVSSQSLIRVRKHTYSVPSRLIGHTLRVELYEPELKVHLGAGVALLSAAAARGPGERWWTSATWWGPLLRKPGAFLQYRHREALYPSVTFRAAFDPVGERSRGAARCHRVSASAQAGGGRNGGKGGSPAGGSIGLPGQVAREPRCATMWRRRPGKWSNWPLWSRV